jgi:hypothetical protein|tara:strand:+ start:132 stop:326 length:195 start_codon:yes stop_codon:yes gene_type:complete
MKLNEQEMMSIVEKSKRLKTNFREQCKTDQEFIQVMNFMYKPKEIKNDFDELDEITNLNNDLHS